MYSLRKKATKEGDKKHMLIKDTVERRLCWLREEGKESEVCVDHLKKEGRGRLK